MTTTSDFGTLNSAIHADHDSYVNLVYLVEKDHNEIVRQYSEIKTHKQIVAAYSINGRHCLVVDVSGFVKKVTRKKKINKTIKE